MIKEIQIKNIQAHEDTTIKFGNGINVLSGSSDNGKTAILRALIWARYNRPLGSDVLCSHWALDNKGKIKEEMAVTVIKENGDWIKRYNGKEGNGYDISIKGKKRNFEALKGAVPEEVVDFFKLNDVSIQKQHDAPFLLSESPGEVAKFFNSLIHLDVIDRVLSTAENYRRKTNTEIKVLDEGIEKTKADLENYEFLDQAQALVEKQGRIENRIEQYQKEKAELDKSIADYEKEKQIYSMSKIVEAGNELIEKIGNAQEKRNNINKEHTILLSKIQDYLEAKKFVDYDIGKAKIKLIAIDGIIQSLTDNNRYKAELVGEIDEYLICNKFSNILPVIEKGKKIINELMSLTIKQMICEVKELKASIEDYEDQKEAIEKEKERIVDLKEQLGHVCPVCGGKLK